MRSTALAALVLALSFLFFGCVQGSLPQQCSGMSGDRLANCVYVRAVIDQNPFNCYSIEKLDIRKTCISDASSTAMKKKLVSMAQNERDMLLIGPNSSETPVVPAGQQPATATNETSSTTMQPGATTGANHSSLDQQVFLQAVDANRIELCEQIGDYETMRSCISQVARQTKVLSVCDSLSTADNIELCRMYTQGGEKG